MRVRSILRALVAFMLTLGTTSLGLSTAAEGAWTGDDALQIRVRSELAVFTSWLRTHGERGYIGEVGWPNNSDTAVWNALAETWYRDAASANLWVAQWSTGEWWGTGYKLSSYVWNAQGGALAGARPPAAVIEAQASTAQQGVNLNGADFGPIGTGLSPTSTLSNANPGVYNTHWHYDKQQSFDYLASRGVKTVRLAFRWERIQPTLGAPLDPTELGRLRAAVGRARTAGLGVVLNAQNYGAYWLSDGTQGVRHAIGSAAVTRSDFADLWQRLSEQFGTDSGVVAYGLMNEPVGLAASGGLNPAQVWERASQAALDAIRATGDVKLVMVPGYQWSGVLQWANQHPLPWIVDPVDNFRYEAHQYFDRNNSGSYANSYAAEVDNAESRGFGVDVVAPTPPGNLAATAGAGKVSLSWTGSTDAGGSGLAGYRVLRAPTPTGRFRGIAWPPTPAYADSAVTSGVPYWYRVVAYDRNGNESDVSTTVSATPS